MRAYSLLTIALLSSVAVLAPAKAETRPSDVTGSIGAPAARMPAGVDAALLREAVAAAERGDTAGATSRAERLGDPVAKDLVEWFLLRAAGDGISHARYMRFLQSNREWPGRDQIMRRAEQALLTSNRPPAEVLAFFANRQPTSAHGRVALAIALRSQGQNDRAAALVREAWRTNEVPEALERIVDQRLPGVLTRADHKARMDRLFYRERAADGLRVAQRLGGAELAIGRARAAVINRAGNAQALLDAVPADARRDPGYMFARIQHFRRADRGQEAAAILAQAPRDPRVLVDPNEWWTERRLVGRMVLEAGDPRRAYQIFSQHSASRDTDKMEAEFHAGWTALRFLNDPVAADQHFARLQADAVRPLSVSRGAFWRGRAAEARGDTWGAQSHFEAAARLRHTFYGQLAMTRLGRNQLQTSGAPQPDEGARQRFERREPVRAIRMMAAAGMIDKTRPFFVGLADEWRDGQELSLLARLGAELGQVRFTMLVGKQAMQRGFSLEPYAFPTNGVPNVQQVGPQVERALVLAIARQESTFDPRIRSSAGAIGLMQMLPSSAQQTARRFNQPWTPARLTDPVYNTQLGSAYLGEVIQEFGGSYILAFAAYNAGRGRVREWIQRFGDPRDPRVDPVDWIERIPFSETRNYVMRIMENLQIYRARLNGSTTALRIDQDLRRRGPATQQTTLASE